MLYVFAYRNSFAGIITQYYSYFSSIVMNSQDIFLIIPLIHPQLAPFGQH